MKNVLLIAICSTFVQVGLLTFDAQHQTRELDNPNCPSGKYGPFCQDNCYCAEGKSCDPNGDCLNGCKKHYKSPKCNSCEDGYFGLDCNKQCHCLNGTSDCNSTTGICNSGKCTIGYEGNACQILTGIPKFESIGAAKSANINQTFIVSCTVVGAPSPKITINYKNLSTEEDVTFTNDENKTTAMIELFTDKIGLHEIECEAQNMHGSASEIFNITVVEPPELNQVPEVKDVHTAHEIIVSWKYWQFKIDKGGIDGDEKDIQYLVVYRLTGSSLWMNSSDWQSTNTSTITNLIADSEYDIAIRCKRSGDKGEGGVGKYSMGYTICGLPNEHGKVQNVSIRIITPSIVQLNWQPPEHKNLGCTLKQFSISYQEVGSPTTLSNSTVVLNKDQLIYEFQNLKPNSKYLFNLKAITHDGNFTSVSYNVDTADFVPGHVTDLTIQEVPNEAQQLLLKWSRPSNITALDDNCIKYNVTVELLEMKACDSFNDKINNVTIFRNSSTEVFVSNLLPYSQYKLSVQAQSTAGASDPIELTTNTTEGVPIGEPSRIYVEEIDLEGLLFRWDPVPCEQANGHLGYRYSLQLFDGNHQKLQNRKKRSNNWVVKDKVTYDNNVTIRNLLNYTDYEFSVKGFTSVGEGPAKKIVKRTSENYAPKLTKPPIITKFEKNEIEIEWLSWKSNSNETDVQPEYMVFYRLKNENQKWSEFGQWQSENLSTITNLTQDSEYEISVRVRNKGKEGPLESTVTSRTKCGLLINYTNPQNVTVKLKSETAAIISWEPPKIGCKFVNYTLIFEEIESSEIMLYNLAGNAVQFPYSGFKLNTAYSVNLTAVTNLNETYKYAQSFFNTSTFRNDKITGKNNSILQIIGVYADQLKFALSREIETVIDKNITYNVLITLKSKIACGKILNQSYHRMINTTVDEIATISNLSPYSIYEFGVEIVSVAGLNKSVVLKKNTTESAPSASISEIFVMERDTRKLSFRWDPIRCDKANGQLAYRYSLLVLNETGVSGNRKKRQTSWIPVVQDVVTNDTSIAFENLTIFTTYEFLIKGFTSAGEGPIATKRAMTADYYPLPPIVSLNKSSSNSLLFDIIPTLPLRGIVIVYQIEIKSTGPNPWFSRITNVTGSKSQHLEDNLLPFSSWDVKIRAETRVGWSAWSSTLTFSTDEGLPEAPGFISFFDFNSTAVQVRLRPPIITNGIILTYKVYCYRWNSNISNYYANSLITSETSNNYSTNVLLNGLEVGSTYIIHASAKTKAGDGEVINGTYIMTGKIDFSRKTTLEYPPPPTPLIIKYNNGQDLTDEITLETIIFAVKNTSGINPKYYQVIVKRLELGNEENNLNGTYIAGYSIATSANHPYWIAALISANQLPIDSSMKFIIGDKNTYDGFYNGPIFKNFTYTIMSRIFNQGDNAFSFISPMALQPKERDTKGSYVGTGCVIATISCIWFMIVVIIVVLLFWIIVAIVVLCKRRRRTKRLSISEGRINNSITGHPNNIWPKKTDGSNTNDCQDTSLTVFQSTDSSLQNGRSKTFNKNCNFFGPILVKDLAEYINQRAANPKIDFPEEYKQATRDKSKPWTIAKKPENLKKNRYGNILPYDMTRVRLEPHPGQPDTDYINASFIDGYDKPKIYIATQGPKENTFQDFWRMVWQENAVVIVMLTALVECRKKKCDQYWPSNSRLYGNILVTLISTEHLADIIIRHFEIKSIEAAEIREVTHYHYTDWPDFSLPPCITSILNLRRKVREEMQKRVSRSPFIVHCSGGAGRTGTFIAIDAMLNQAYEEDRVNVFRFTSVMWGCRCNLIQNAEQYRFVYDAVLEALQSGDTKVICNRLPTYYRDICRTSECEPSDLAEQFNILNRLERRSSCFSCPEALNEENTKKNRNHEILPIEHSRVRLRSIYEPVFEEDETQDDLQPLTVDPYINAVLVDGFKLKGQFLVTHMPLDDTVQDFWRMMVLNKSSVIVMLNDCEFIDENTVPGQYWPNEGCIQYGPYQVEVVQFEEMGMVTLRTLRVIDTRKINEFMPLGVMQLQFLDWIPDKKVPAAASSILSLINFADVYRHKYGGPITLHCQDGASRCGVFCAAYNIKEQIETGEVDIFQTIKRLRRHRPQFITSIEQYQFCYEIAAARVAELHKDSTLSTLV